MTLLELYIYTCMHRYDYTLQCKSTLLIVNACCMVNVHSSLINV